MKKFTSLFLAVVMVVTMVIACIPASAADKVDVNSILDDAGYNNEAAKDWMWAGKSNCYYFDYFLAAKNGKIGSGGDPGNDYSLRAGKLGGSGSAGVCDGSKTSGSFSHDTGSDGFTVGGKKYTHYFGFSYKDAVTADSFAFYSSKDVAKYDNITSLDVYVASVNATNDGPGEWKLVGGATTSTTYTDDAGTALLFEGNFTEAATFNYVFFAVNCDNFAPDNNRYKVYEFSLFAPVVPEKENVMLCTDDEGFAESGKNVAQWQQAGLGNVFYYDYLAAVAAGKELKAGKDPGADYKLRLPTYSGSGTAAICDGVKDSSATTHSFTKGEFAFAGKTYDHAFGYCFKEAVTVNEFAFYTSAKTDEKAALITGLDVYGGTRNADGTVDYKLLWSSGTTNIQDTKTAEGAAYATGTFDAVTINYIRFAVTTSITEGSSSYRPYEAELFATDEAPVVPDDTTASTPDDTTAATPDDTTVTDPGATGDYAFAYVAVAVVAVLGVALVAKRRHN